VNHYGKWPKAKVYPAKRHSVFDCRAASPAGFARFLSASPLRDPEPRFWIASELPTIRELVA
jgi:hypothetical protein